MIPTKPDRLILFTRLPEAGKAKTRLIPALGPHGAAGLQWRLGRLAAQTGQELSRHQPLELEACCTGGGGGGEGDARAWLGEDWAFHDQGEGDLGERMARALGRALAQGHGRVVLMGADCPKRDEAYLERAFEALAGNDVVLGPTVDGGYHLVGLRRSAPRLFQGIPWGGDQVLAASLERARAAGLSCALLEPLPDLDRPSDLDSWTIPGLISVVIPTLNEAANLPGTLARVRSEVGQVETIVADAGSADATRELAQKAGAQVLAPGQGRGLQMQAGAGAARGEYLVFLHADTRLSPGWADEVRRILDRPGVSLGSFGFALDAPGAGLRLVELMVALRCGLARLPYGDQALFIKSATLRRLGGFPDWPLMEDVELVRRAKKIGRLGLSPLPAISSARRWQERGLARTTLANWGLLLRFWLGVEPHRLARHYYG